MPEAREVSRVEGLATVDDSARSGEFLERCRVGTFWHVRIRTATVVGEVLARSPLGTISEQICTCVRLGLDRPVPVEPGLRFQIEWPDDPGLTATAVVRPWGAA
jgi:hypothetical protein